MITVSMNSTGSSLALSICLAEVIGYPPGGHSVTSPMRRVVADCSHALTYIRRTLSLGYLALPPLGLGRNSCVSSTGRYKLKFVLNGAHL